MTCHTSPPLLFSLDLDAAGVLESSTKQLVNCFLFSISIFTLLNILPFTPRHHQDHVSKLSIMVVQTSLTACCQIQPFVPVYAMCRNFAHGAPHPLTGPSAPRFVSPGPLAPRALHVTSQRLTWSLRSRTQSRVSVTTCTQSAARYVPATDVEPLHPHPKPCLHDRPHPERCMLCPSD